MLWKLFVSFWKIGAFTIGGGYVMIPLMEQEIVDRRKWLTREEFLDYLSLSQAMPGIFAVNMATCIGRRLGGIRGIIAAIAGNILMPIAIILVIAISFRYVRDNVFVERIFMGLRPAVVALIFSAGLNMLLQVVFGGRDSLGARQIQWAGAALLAGAFFILRRFRWNPILVMALCGAAGLGLGLIGAF